jgi:hypothetical protein
MPEGKGFLRDTLSERHDKEINLESRKASLCPVNAFGYFLQKKYRTNQVLDLDFHSTCFPLFITQSEFITPPLRGNDGKNDYLTSTLL